MVLASSKVSIMSNCYLCDKPLYEDEYNNRDTCIQGIRVHRHCDTKIQRNDKKINTAFMAKHRARHEHLAKNISKHYPHIKVHIEHWSESSKPSPLVLGETVRLADSLVEKYGFRYGLVQGKDNSCVKIKPMSGIGRPKVRDIPLSLSSLIYCATV